MKNEIVLKQFLTKDFVDIFIKNKNIKPKIKYKNTYFETDSYISFKVIQAEKKQNLLINTIRYIDINQIKQKCFYFSNNIPASSIFLKIEGYQIDKNTNKILVQSLKNLQIPVSAYAIINDKEYYLNTNICNIQNYQIYIDFNDNKIVIPKDINFNYSLKEQLNLELNYYPSDLISTQISLNNEKLKDLNTIQLISGKLTDINEKKLSGVLQYKIYNYQTNNYYDVKSIKKDIYIVSTSYQDVLWLSKKDFQLLYNKNKIHIKNINFDGDQNLNLSVIPKIIQSYVLKNNTYQKTDEVKNINKLLLNEKIYCENILINQFETEAYIYSNPIIIKNNFVFLDKAEHKIDLNEIVYYPTDAGLTNNIKVNNQNNITSITFSPQLTSSLIQFEKITSDDNQYKCCIDEIAVNSKFFNIKNKKSSINVQLNNNTYVLSGIYSTDDINLQIINNNKQYYNVILSSFSKPNGIYTYYINNIKTNNVKLLNTQYTTFNTNITYTDIENNQHQLSSVTYNVICYGDFIDLSKKQYVILTLSGNNELDALKLKNNDEYIIDPSQQINIKVQEKYKCINTNITQLKYINFDYEKNYIYTKNLTYDNVLQIKKQIAKKQYYIKFKDNKNNQIKYVVGFKNLFKFPGEKYFQVKFNDNLFNINNIEDFYENKFLLQDKNLLIIDTINFISFEKIQLDISRTQEFDLELLCNINNKEQFNDNLIDMLSCISNNYDYNISGKYFNYYNDKFDTNIITYGKYDSFINITPKTLTNNNIIQNFNKRKINLTIKPEQQDYINNSISGIYYNNNLYYYYGNIKIDELYGNINEYIVDLSKVFRNIQNLVFQQINYDYLKIENNKLIIDSSILNILPQTIYINTINDIIAILDIDIDKGE